MRETPNPTALTVERAAEMTDAELAEAVAVHVFGAVPDAAVAAQGDAAHAA